MDYLRDLVDQGHRASVHLLHGAQMRRDAPFSPDVDEDLQQMMPDLFDRFPIVLPWEQPKSVDPALHEVWLMDNTAFQTPSSGDKRSDLGKVESAKDSQPELVGADGKTTPAPAQGSGWEVEFVGCYFIKDSGRDVSKVVASVAELLNIGQDDTAKRGRIAKRLRPFVDYVLPNRTLRIVLDGKEEQTLGPSNYSGISTDLLPLHFQVPPSPSEFKAWSVQTPPPFGYSSTTVVASEHGWGVISDIDDTIKVTQTSSPLGILRETFVVEDPEPITGMPELYAQIAQKLSTPAFFYLSASPYNLYPFLKEFRNKHYPQGTIMLRDASWQNLGGLVSSLSKGTEEYKEDRIKRIHAWLPHRQFICIGDSTQSDPEAYGDSARRYPGWIKGIFIRKVTNIAAVGTEQKNSAERFEKAFRGLDIKLWHVFTDPNELVQRIDSLAQSPDTMVGDP